MAQINLLIKLQDILLSQLGKISSSVHTVINYVGSIQELPDEWKNRLSSLSIRSEMKKDCSNYRGISGVARKRRGLRHCATSRKVAGSIPDGVTATFH